MRKPMYIRAVLCSAFTIFIPRKFQVKIHWKTRLRKENFFIRWNMQMWLSTVGKGKEMYLNRPVFRCYKWKNYADGFQIFLALQRVYLSKEQVKLSEMGERRILNIVKQFAISNLRCWVLLSVIWSWGGQNFDMKWCNKDFTEWRANIFELVQLQCKYKSEQQSQNVMASIVDSFYWTFEILKNTGVENGWSFWKWQGCIFVLIRFLYFFLWQWSQSRMKLDNQFCRNGIYNYWLKLILAICRAARKSSGTLSNAEWKRVSGKHKWEISGERLSSGFCGILPLTFKCWCLIAMSPSCSSLHRLEIIQ